MVNLTLVSEGAMPHKDGLVELVVKLKILAGLVKEEELKEL